MPEVKLNSAQISRVLSDHAAKRVLVDFVSDNPGKPRVLGRDFDRAIEKEANNLANLAAPQLEKYLKDHYKETFDVVTRVLHEGIPRNAALDIGAISPGTLKVKFHKLSKHYYARKAATHPETADLFWKYTGKMYKAMRAFANNRKAAVSWSKPKVQLIARGRQRHGRRFRFEIDFFLPEIKSSPFLDNIFRRAYLTGANSGRYGSYNKLGFGTITAAKHSDPLSYLQFNETIGPRRKDGQPKTRPFITELVSRRGQQVQTILLRGVQRLV